MAEASESCSPARANAFGSDLDGSAEAEAISGGDAELAGDAIPGGDAITVDEQMKNGNEEYRIQN